MEFIRNWHPDLLMTLIFIIGGIIQVFIAPIFAKGVVVKRWRVGGVLAALFGLILLAIRFI